MGHGFIGRPAALLALSLFGLLPAFGQGRNAGLDRESVLARAGQCPTRFDYLVLASFADAPRLLSLSTYRFRSQMGFSSIRLTGFQRVGFAVEPASSNCRPRGPASAGQAGRRFRGSPVAQGGGLAGMSAKSAERRSSQIT